MVVYEISRYIGNQWVPSRLTSFDELWDRIVKGRDYGDLFVGEQIILPISKEGFKELLIPDIEHNVFYKTYVWDDDNEKLTFSEMYKVRIIESTEKPASTIRGSKFKKWINTLPNNAEISFYIGNTRYYPDKMENDNGNVMFILKRSDDQNKL